MRFLMNENLCSKLQIEEMNENQLLTCLLSLNALESTILLYLFSHPHSTIKSMARAVNRHRSTVQKALEQLMRQGLALRQTHSLPRGYAYTYTAISKQELKKAIIQDIKEWSQMIEKKFLS